MHGGRPITRALHVAKFHAQTLTRARSTAEACSMRADKPSAPYEPSKPRGPQEPREPREPDGLGEPLDAGEKVDGMIGPV